LEHLDPLLVGSKRRILIVDLTLQVINKIPLTLDMSLLRFEGSRLILDLLLVDGVEILLFADQAEDLEHAFEREEPLELGFDLVLGLLLLFLAMFQLMFSHVVDEIFSELLSEDEGI
jgi:hypothetical protein